MTSDKNIILVIKYEDEYGMEKIKLLVMDVDGTMTDGKINMGTNGEVYKSFNVKDGYGINELLPQNNIKSAIITGRTSSIVENRANELGINYVYQGIKNKLDKIYEIANEMGINTKQIAYIGDDIIDLACMNVSGLSGCPSDAVKEIKNKADFISQYKGGEGAIREFIEWLIQENYA